MLVYMPRRAKLLSAIVGICAGTVPSASAASFAIADCGGSVVQIDTASLKPLAGWQLPKLGWAPAVQDGCVVNSLTYDPWRRLLWTAAPLQPGLDAQGQRRYQILAWSVTDSKLIHRIALAESLTSAPNLLVDSSGVRVAYETSDGSGAAELPLADGTTAEAVLKRSDGGLWFSSQAVLVSHGVIVDGGAQISKTASGWEKKDLAPRNTPSNGRGVMWEYAGSAPTAIVYAAPAGSGQTQLFVINPATGQSTSKRLDGTFLAGELRLAPDGKHMLAVAKNSCRLSLWDLNSARKSSAATGGKGPCELVCAGNGGFAIVRDGSKLDLFSPAQPKLREITISPADSSTQCAFIPSGADH
jgi:hypothetical protein